MKYLSMTLATDWFFVHPNELQGAKSEHTVHHLAVWALTEAGEIIGLVPVSDHAVSGATTARLVPPPPIKGRYVHRDEFTPSMRESLAVQK